MEKYRKFDDARVGVNPFVPSKPLETNAVMSIFKTVSKRSTILSQILLQITNTSNCPFLF